MGVVLEMFKEWGLKANPFSHVAPPVGTGIIEKVFVGRDDELEKLIRYIRFSIIPINIHITGDYGVGKTIFLRKAIELLSAYPDVLPVYLNVEGTGNTSFHFGNSVLHALARQLGIAFQETNYPKLKLEGHLKDLSDKKVAFFVDQLEYKDPFDVVNLLIESRPILDLPCSFVITGHPFGITESIYTSASGIFADRIDLRTLNSSELLRIVVRYLNLARVEPVENSLPFEEETVREIAQVNRGLPRFVNLDCYKVLDEAAQDGLPTITIDDLNRLYTQLGIRHLQTLPYETRFWVQQVATRGVVSEEDPDEFLSSVGATTYTDARSRLERLKSEEVLIKVETEYGDRYFSQRSIELGSQALKRNLETPKVSTRVVWLDYDQKNHVLCAESREETGRLISRTSGETCKVEIDGYFAMMQFISRNPMWREAIRQIGQSLFRETIMDLPAIHAEFQRALGATGVSGQVSLVLCTTSEGLRIPFELALHRDYLCLDYPISRFVKDRECQTSFGHIITSGIPLIRVLLVASDTGGLSAVDDEIAAVEETIKEKAPAGVEVDFLALPTETATCSRVRDELESGEYHLFHYAGHGYFKADEPEKSHLVLWADESKTERDYLTASDLKDLVMKTQLRFAYLSCCEGMTTGSTYHSNFLGVADALVNGGVPEVIGYRWPVADESAEALTVKFYESYFTNGFSSSEALWKARRAVARGPEKRDDSAWASPILIRQF